MEQLHRVGEVSKLMGVSVRTLHHYDQISLLSPSARTEGGQRLYTERDLLYLQQILTLRWLGFPLKQVGEVLSRPDFDLLASLRIQRNAVRERITEMERIEATLEELINHWTITGRWAWELVVQVSAALQSNSGFGGNKMEKYYTPEQMKQFEELGKQFTPEQILEVERQWTTLIAEVRENLSVDPASPKAQELANQWNALIQQTFQGNTELMQAVGENYKNGSFDNVQGTPDPEVFAFIERANKSRKDR